jgi:serine/threonine-protein kinase
MRRNAQELAKLSRLLDTALELPIQDRANWIDQLDAANEELKTTLRQMLFGTPEVGVADTKGVGRYLDVAVRSAASTMGISEFEAGAQVGPYELIREIGRGGMGAVWLSRRIEGLTRRLVALKLPHPGLQSAVFAQRIARERDILESLTHPHIARLYEAGVTPAGQAYLALEYVEGTAITTYCDAKRLNTRERVVLIQQVLNAMQYAHTQLVIHRDLKPANILVTEAGQAQLLDFGIAKLLTDDSAEDPALTRVGGRALTLDYASPEQIAGDALGTASDVYSLGIVMYELLTGQRPYKLAKGPSIERGLAEIAIARPSSAVSDVAVRRSLTGDLDTILLKALKFAPAERYTTIAALAAVVAALGVGLTVSLWEMRKARLEAARAEQVKSFALAMLDSADSDSGAGATTTAVDLLQAARKRVEVELARQPAIAKRWSMHTCSALTV